MFVCICILLSDFIKDSIQSYHTTSALTRSSQVIARNTFSVILSNIPSTWVCCEWVHLYVWMCLKVCVHVWACEDSPRGEIDSSVQNCLQQIFCFLIQRWPNKWMRIANGQPAQTKSWTPFATFSNIFSSSGKRIRQGNGLTTSRK